MKNKQQIFTKEYFGIIEEIKEENTIDEHLTFRETKKASAYNGIAIEIVQEELCQLSCEWCYINQSKRDKLNKPLRFEEFKGIIDKIIRYNNSNQVTLFSNIIFIGGEPTINLDLSEMIEYSIKNKLKPIVVTNGLKLADKDYAKTICLKGVNITTHLPLFGEEGEVVLNQATKSDGYTTKLKQAIKNILELRQQGIDIEIVGELVVCKTTLEYAFDSYVYCRNNNILPFFEFVHISNDKIANKHLLLEGIEIHDFGKKVYQYDLENHFVSKESVKKIRYILPPAVNSPCTLIQNSIHIKFEKSGFGKVISCCGQDIGHGNIIIDSLEDILKHKEETKIFSDQKSHIKGPCSICELYDLSGCEGGCRGDAKKIFDCAEASDPQCVLILPEIQNDKEIMTADKSYFEI